MNASVSTSYHSKPARADSEIDLAPGDQGGKRRVLKISTYKGDGKMIMTYARVIAVDGKFLMHLIGSDFHCRVRSAPFAATDRNVRAEHTAALELLPELLKAARAHHGFADVDAPTSQQQPRAA
jgi:hypothetical protein